MATTASDLRSDDEMELEKKISNGSAYEASQLYLGHMGRLRSTGKLTEAEAAGSRGVFALVKANEPSLATPIALTVIEDLGSRVKEFDDSTFDILIKLVTVFNDYNEEKFKKEKLIISKAVCKLVNKRVSISLHPKVQLVNSIRAFDLDQAGHVAEAAKHYALIDQPNEYALLIQKWASKGYESEKDLFGVRAVLQLLSLGQHRCKTAKQLHIRLIELKVLGGNSPLEHFLTFILELINQVEQFMIGKAGASSVFTTLLTSYRPVLQSRDVKIAQLAERVGVVHFGWTPPPNPMSGFMNMFN